MKKIKSSKGLIPTMRDDVLNGNKTASSTLEFEELKQLFKPAGFQKTREMKPLIWLGAYAEFEKFIEDYSIGRTKEEIENFKSLWRFEE